MSKAIKNFDDVVMALAGELQDADLYHHCEAEKFIVIDNDDNTTVNWKLEDELTSYSGETVITIIPDTEKTCLENQLYSTPINKIAELMGMSTCDLCNLIGVDEEADSAEIVVTALNSKSDVVDKLIVATGGIIRDYYKEAENLLISAEYTR